MCVRERERERERENCCRKEIDGEYKYSQRQALCGLSNTSNVLNKYAQYYSK